MSNNSIISPDWLPIRVEGNDIVVDKATATSFGGSNDPMDDGQTSSGVSTKLHPTILGCSLPMNYQGKDQATRRAVGGSPIPMLPFGLFANGKPNPNGTLISVTYNGKIQILPLIDIGPALWTKHAIDLTVTAFTNFGVKQSIGVLPVSFRILGAAKYLKNNNTR